MGLTEGCDKVRTMMVKYFCGGVLGSPCGLSGSACGYEGRRYETVLRTTVYVCVGHLQEGTAGNALGVQKLPQQRTKALGRTKVNQSVHKHVLFTQERKNCLPFTFDEGHFTFDETVFTSTSIGDEAAARLFWLDKATVGGVCVNGQTFSTANGHCRLLPTVILVLPVCEP